MPGAIAIDLDGTLLDSRDQLSPRNRLAIESCLEHGIPIVIATSRAARSVQQLLGEKLTGGCSQVLMNGALAIGVPPLSGLIRETIPPDIACGVVELTLCMAMAPGVRLVVELDGYEFGTTHPLNPDRLREIESATPEMVISIPEALARGPTKVAVNGLGQELSNVASEITRRFGRVVSVVPSDGATFLNIVSTKASKSETLRRLLSPHGISLANVVALGDDVPDIDMLNTCGASVAVANAVPEVAAAARYSTASNDDDGVAMVLELILARLGR